MYTHKFIFVRVLTYSSPYFYQVVLFSPSVLRLPYSITVFEDRLYWTDWSQLALYSANKFNGEDVRNVSAGHLVSFIWNKTKVMEE